MAHTKKPKTAAALDAVANGRMSKEEACPRIRRRAQPQPSAAATHATATAH